MTENLAGVPLSGGARALDAVQAEAVQLSGQALGRGGNDGHRITIC
jgi:hypothetical protein